MPRRVDLTCPRGRAAYLSERHYADLVRRAPGAYPSPLSRATAEDAVQDVLGQIAGTRRPLPQNPNELLAYATVAVQRTNARLVRERSNSPLVSIDDTTEPAAGGDPAGEQAEHLDALACLRRILDGMGEARGRRIAVLHLLSYRRDEIARSVGATSRQVRRVIERVQVLVEEERRIDGEAS